MGRQDQKEEGDEGGIGIREYKSNYCSMTHPLGLLGK